MAHMNIQRDARVMTADGEVGRVSHVVVDPQTKELTDIVVSGDGGDRLVPVSQIDSVDGGRVTLRGGRAAVQGMTFDREHYHEVDEDEVRDTTTRTAERGGAPVVDADDDQVEIAGTRQAQGATHTEHTERRATRGEGPTRLQLREERLRVTTTQEQAGEVRLGTRVTEHTETVNVPVREERVIIERTAGSGQPADGGDLREGETIEVPLMKERVTVEKEAVVSEEVNVRKEVTERQERVSDTVRREELVVEEGEGLIAEGDSGRGGSRRSTESDGHSHRS